jgi:hypothetical protein
MGLAVVAEVGRRGCCVLALRALPAAPLCPLLELRETETLCSLAVQKALRYKR